MKILVTGGSGLLGKEIQEQVAKNPQGCEWSFPSSSELNIIEFRKCYDAVQYCDVVLHCAALTRLDRCEEEKARAYNINVMGTGMLTRACDQHDKRLIYISTDYIFDGDRGDYTEKDCANPLSFYAKTKWAGECIVLSYLRQVIRTSFFRKDIWPHPKAFNDKYTSADTVDKIADLIIKATVNCFKWSHVLNIGTERKTFYDIAKRLSPEVIPMSHKDIGIRVKIPTDTSLNTDKMKTVLGV